MVRLLNNNQVNRLRYLVTVASSICLFCSVNLLAIPLVEDTLYRADQTIHLLQSNNADFLAHLSELTLAEPVAINIAEEFFLDLNSQFDLDPIRVRDKRRREENTYIPLTFNQIETSAMKGLPATYWEETGMAKDFDYKGRKSFLISLEETKIKSSEVAHSLDTLSLFKSTLKEMVQVGKTSYRTFQKNSTIENHLDDSENSSAQLQRFDGSDSDNSRRNSVKSLYNSPSSAAANLANDESTHNSSPFASSRSILLPALEDIDDSSSKNAPKANNQPLTDSSGTVKFFGSIVKFFGFMKEMMTEETFWLILVIVILPLYLVILVSMRR